MYCNGKVIYKGISKREGGTCVINGNTINYDPAYVIKFDEVKDGKADERKVKFPTSNKDLYEKLKDIKMYTEIELKSEVEFTPNACKIVPYDVVVVEYDEENN